MRIRITLKSTRGKFDAIGVYEDGIVVVYKGSRVNKVTAEKIGGGSTVRAIRENKSLVDIDGMLLADCTFSSPSTAANFVTGRSANGYVAWRVDEKNNLGKYLSRDKTKGSMQKY